MNTCTARRRRRVFAAIALALTLSSVLSSAHAVRKREEENRPTNVPESGPWRESQISPPPYPQNGDLIEFKPNGRTANRFFVDGTSVSVGEDEVVRFVLVVRTPADVENVSFAGVRCETREWKDYAFATRERTWRVAEKPNWRAIPTRNVNNHQETLYKDYFCFGGAMSGGPIGDAKAIVRNLKYPLVPDNHTPRRYNERPSN